MPLCYNSGAGRIMTVEELLAAGAGVNLTATAIESCILIAAFNGHTDVVRALVSAGANVNLQRHDGVSPLTIASGRVCKPAYLVHVPSQDKYGGLCHEGNPA